SVRSAAHRSGSDAFLAPEIRTVPSSGRPPTTRILSMTASLAGTGPPKTGEATRPRAVGRSARRREAALRLGGGGRGDLGPRADGRAGILFGEPDAHQLTQAVDQQLREIDGLADDLRGNGPRDPGLVAGAFRGGRGGGDVARPTSGEGHDASSWRRTVPRF